VLAEFSHRNVAFASVVCPIIIVIVIVIVIIALFVIRSGNNGGICTKQ
jgi:hypothetical protein